MRERHLEAVELSSLQAQHFGGQGCEEGGAALVLTFAQAAQWKLDADAVDLGHAGQPGRGERAAVGLGVRAGVEHHPSPVLIHPQHRGHEGIAATGVGSDQAAVGDQILQQLKDLARTTQGVFLEVVAAPAVERGRSAGGGGAGFGHAGGYRFLGRDGRLVVRGCGAHSRPRSRALRLRSTRRM